MTEISGEYSNYPEKYDVVKPSSDDDKKSADEKKPVFSQYDDTKNLVANYKEDSQTKGFIESLKFNGGDWKSSRFTSEQTTKMDSIWNKASDFEYKYSGQEQNIDSQVKSQMNSYMQDINSQLEQAYKSAIEDTKEAEYERIDEDEKEAAHERALQEIQEKEKAEKEADSEQIVNTKEVPKDKKSPEKPKSISVAVPMTVAKTAESASKIMSGTSNAVSGAASGVSGTVDATTAGLSQVEKSVTKAASKYITKGDGYELVELENAGKVNGLQKLAKGAKIGGYAISAGITAYNAYDSAFGDNGKFLKDDEGNFDRKALDASLVEVGKGVGGVIGADIGGTIGSVVPVVGTAAGAYVGAKVGEVVGGDIVQGAIEIEHVWEDDNDLSTGEKVLKSAEIGVDTTANTAKDVTGVVKDIGSNVTQFGIKYATPLNTVDVAVRAFGSEETIANLDKAEDLIDKGVDGVWTTAEKTIDAGLSLVKLDTAAAKAELGEALDGAKQTFKSQDKLITGVAHKAKSATKSVASSAKFTVDPNSKNTIDKAKQKWNSGVDSGTRLASSAYHTASDAYNGTKEYAKKGYKLIRNWFS